MLYRPWVFEQPLTVPPTAYTSLVCLYIVTGKQLVNKPSSCDYVKKKKKYAKFLNEKYSSAMKLRLICLQRELKLKCRFAAGCRKQNGTN